MVQKIIFMKKIYIIIIMDLLYCNFLNGQNRNEVWTFKNFERTEKILVESQIKISCPFEKSKDILKIDFTGRFANYSKADTWYPTWATDGNLYSPWTDGSIAGEKCSSGSVEKARTGQAKIEGDDPLNLKIVSLGTHEASSLPYHGRYPCGSLIYEGVWYYGTYTLNHAEYGLNWPILGPFAGFRISYDMGKTWIKSPVYCEPGKTLFPEPQEINGPVKIGAPHFVDFGKNMKYSPDGKAYLIGHGATEKDMEDRKANLSWITGDHIYLCRVKPSPETINNEEAYEYFAGNDKNDVALWSENYEDIKPLINWDNNCGCVTMTYNAPLEKYIMCVTDGWPTVETMNTYLLESCSITGPWKIISYWKEFGSQAYFVNIPSKFISRDGLTMWLCLSANFTNRKNRNSPEYLKYTNPPGSGYSMSLHEIQMLLD
jgi:hypothetical protein